MNRATTLKSVKCVGLLPSHLKKRKLFLSGLLTSPGRMNCLGEMHLCTSCDGDDIGGCTQNEKMGAEPNRTEQCKDYHKIHEEACRKGEHMYIDPATGYSVFTRVAHLRRGVCCGSGCRHCPYDHINVKHKPEKS